MPTITPLPTSRLHATFDPARVPWEDIRQIPQPRNGRRNPFQPRAMQALDLALQIKAQGYNVYVSGDPDLGRSHMLLTYLRPQARKAPIPPDLVYVHNFADPDRPTLLPLPAGQGIKLKQSLKNLVEQIEQELPRRFEAGAYVKRRARLVDTFQNARLGLLRKMNSVAVDKGFNLDMDDSGGLTLYPLVEGKRLSEEEFDRLDSTVRLKLKSRGDTLVQAMSGFMRQLSRAEETLQDGERDLEREALGQVLDALLNPLRQRFLKICAQVPGLEAYFDALRADMLKNPEAFLQREAAAGPGDHSQADDVLYRYAANLLVDNSALTGAPVVVEDHPTAVNLLGCVERESEMGALVTDFTLIRGGQPAPGPTAVFWSCMWRICCSTPRPGKDCCAPCAPMPPALKIRAKIRIRPSAPRALCRTPCP